MKRSNKRKIKFIASNLANPILQIKNVQWYVYMYLLV